MKSFNLCARADPLCHARLLLSFLAPQFTRVRIGVVVSAFLSGTAVHAYVSEVLEARVRTYLLRSLSVQKPLSLPDFEPTVVYRQ